MRVTAGVLEDSRGLVQLKGINWFGLNNGTTMLDGLWGQDSLSKDFATVVWRLKLLGFNAVRLPFSFQDLHQLPPRDWSSQWTCPTEADMQKAVTPPNRKQTSTHALPFLPSLPDRQQANVCNDYLPSSSTYDRYCWVVDFFASNGFYVLVDNHLREDQTALQDSNRWAQQWAQLVADLTKNSNTAEHLLVDVLNEPDNYGIRWEPAAGKPGLTELYLQAMDAIHAVAPQVPFLLEGTGQSGIGANWGDGFATDPQLVKSKGLSDPTLFFQALLSRPYANQVVICPHVYGPAVTHSSQGGTGQGLSQRLSQSFGYLTQQGFPGPQGNQVFPVAVGEFGSKFEDAQDVTAMQDLALYLENKGAGADGLHSAIPHWFYWCWNANSGDTGGVVADDWCTINWQKIDYLITCGLRPWYLDNTTPAADPSSILPQSNPMPKPMPNLSSNLGQALHPTQQQPAGQQQVWVMPQQTQHQQGVATQGQQWQVSSGGGSPSDGSSQAVVSVGQPWQAAPGKWQCDVNVVVKNTGKSVVSVPWNFSMHCNQYEALTQCWCWQASCTAKTVSGTATEAWLAMAPGGEAKVGGVVECQRASATADDFMPDAALLNGHNCSVTRG